MRLSGVFAVLMGLLLAGASVIYASGAFTRPEVTQVVATVQPPPLETVVVATRALKYGEQLRSDMLEAVEWPAGALPEGAFKAVDDLLGASGDGRIVLRRIDRGEPVLTSKISGFGQRASIAAQLPDGQRAFTIRIDDVSGVAGFLLPGDRVDVMLTRRNNEQELTTNVILQNVMVLGIDQSADQEAEKPKVGRTATVQVNPTEAQKLALAMQVGTLTLALRQVGSTENVEQSQVGVEDLKIGDPDKKTSVVRIRRGAEVSEEKLAE